MAETFKFELVSPERLLVSADVAEVLVPGSEGDFTVLPRHAPVIAMLLSTLVEGYRWSWLGVAGIALAAAGNVLVLRRPASRV